MASNFLALDLDQASGADIEAFLKNCVLAPVEGVL